MDGSTANNNDDETHFLPSHQNSTETNGYPTSLKLRVLVITFIAYACFHMTRKPNGIVKSALHPVSSDGTSKYDRETDPGWFPFNQDVDPLVVSQHGLNLEEADEASGLYRCPNPNKVVGRCMKFVRSIGPDIDFEISLSRNSICRTTARTIEHRQKDRGLCWIISKRNKQYNESRTALFVQFYDGDLPAYASADVKDGVFWYQIDETGTKFTQRKTIKSVANIKSGQVLLGYLDTAFLLSYTFGLFGSGFVADRVNLRMFLFVGMLGSGLCLIALGFAFEAKIHSLEYFIFINVIAGLFQSTGWPSVVTIMASWFGHGNRGFIMGIWNAHTSIGNILGSVVTAAAIEKGLHHEDWPLGFVAPGVIMCGTAVLVYALIIPYPKDAGLPSLGTESNSDSHSDYVPLIEENADTPTESETLRDTLSTAASSFRKALSIPGLIPFALCLAFAKMCAYSLLYWGPSFLSHVGFSSADAGYLCSFFDIGGIFGGILAGLLADKTGSHATVAFGFLIITVPLIMVYYSESVATGTDKQANIWLMMMIGFFINAPYALITTAVSADLGSHKSVRDDDQVLATVTGIIDGTGSLGAVLQGAIIGGISTSSWKTVFQFLMLAEGLAACIMLPLVWKDLKKRFQEEAH